MLKNGDRKRKVYICYFDESGFKGQPHPKQKHANWFVLNCIMIEESDWATVLDALVQLRRQLRDDFGVLPRVELKGRHFRSGLGAFSGLNTSRKTRMEIYKSIMNYQSTLPIHTFSIAVRKRGALDMGWNDPMYCAWNFALNRLHIRYSNIDEWCSIYPDDGHAELIRRCIRSMRRHNVVPKRYGPGTFRLRTERILEDPSNRKSTDSYFVQLADINAYASHRSKYVEPISKMNADIWDELATEFDDVRVLEINKNDGKGRPPGIKIYPNKAQSPT